MVHIAICHAPSFSKDSDSLLAERKVQHCPIPSDEWAVLLCLASVKQVDSAAFFFIAVSILAAERELQGRLRCDPRRAFGRLRPPPRATELSWASFTSPWPDADYDFRTTHCWCCASQRAAKAAGDAHRPAKRSNAGHASSLPLESALNAAVPVPVRNFSHVSRYDVIRTGAVLGRSGNLAHRALWP